MPFACRITEFASDRNNPGFRENTLADVGICFLKLENK